MLWRWLFVLLICISVTTALSGPVFYQRHLVAMGHLRLDLVQILQNCFGKKWGFCLLAILIYGPPTMAMFWLYNYVNCPNGIYAWRGIWEFRIAFWVQSLLIYGPATMVIFWLYDFPVWFYGLTWVISMTLLLADRISTTGWIYFFNRELPDGWMILGMILLVACMIMSIVSHYKPLPG